MRLFTSSDEAGMTSLISLADCAVLTRGACSSGFGRTAVNIGTRLENWRRERECDCLSGTSGCYWIVRLVMVIIWAASGRKARRRATISHCGLVGETSPGAHGAVADGCERTFDGSVVHKCFQMTAPDVTVARAQGCRAVQQRFRIDRAPEALREVRLPAAVSALSVFSPAVCSGERLYADGRGAVRLSLPRSRPVGLLGLDSL